MNTGPTWRSKLLRAIPLDLPNRNVYPSQGILGAFGPALSTSKYSFFIQELQYLPPCRDSVSFSRRPPYCVASTTRGTQSRKSRHHIVRNTSDRPGLSTRRAFPSPGPHGWAAERAISSVLRRPSVKKIARSANVLAHEHRHLFLKQPGLHLMAARGRESNLLRLAFGVGVRVGVGVGVGARWRREKCLRAKRSERMGNLSALYWEFSVIRLIV